MLKFFAEKNVSSFCSATGPVLHKNIHCECSLELPQYIYYGCLLEFYEVILMSTHNVHVCYYGNIAKNIELSPNTL